MELLHSTVIGSGAPLLILHGYFGMSDNWKSLGMKYAEDFEVHLIDHRNHGRSFHSDEFDYEILVEDLHFYMQEKGLEKASIIGHSMGGKAGMLFAVTYPEMVDKLLVADIAPKEYAPHHQTILEGLGAVDFDIQKTRKQVEELLSLYLDDAGVRQFLLKNVYWKEKGQLAYRFNLQSLTDNNDEVGVALPSFTSFEGDTLFLRGGNSNYIQDEDEALIKAHFPNSDIKTIENAGHWLHAENATDFYAESRKFLLS